VFKSHGGADAYGYEWAIQRAFDAAKYDVLSRIATTIAELMPHPEIASKPAETGVDGASGEIVITESTQQKTA